MGLNTKSHCYVWRLKMDNIVFSDLWVREIYFEEGKRKFTFCGVLEKEFDQISHYWNPTTRTKHINTFESIILPNLEKHNEKSIDEFTFQDFQDCIDSIKNTGYMRGGTKKTYSLSTLKSYQSLIYSVVYYGSVKEYCTNIFFGTVFESDIKEIIKDKDTVLMLKKSLSIKQEKKLVDYFRNNVLDLTGEEMALLLMSACGLRNAEAVALNYGDIRKIANNLLAYAMVYKSTKPKTSVLQASGKTCNMGRRVPIPVVAEVIIKQRREWVEDLFQTSKEIDLKIDEVPICSRGNLSSVNLMQRCRADDISNMAKTLFHKIGIESNQLVVLQQEINESKNEVIFEEKEPTAYLLRRNYATKLKILGLTITQIQYLMGHDIEDPYHSRSNLNNDEELSIISKKILEMPFYNELKNKSIIKLELENEVKLISIETLEPTAPLEIKLLNEEGIEITVINSEQEYKLERTVDISEKLFETVYKINK